VRIRRIVTIVVALLMGLLAIGLGATPASADSTPGIDVGDVTMARTTAGATNFVFPVTLEYASNNSVTVNYSTSDGSARSTRDYTPMVGTLTFAPGAVSKTVTVPVAGYPLHTGNLYFYLSLSSPVNAAVNHGSGVGTIIDPTLLPYVNLGNANAVEGSGASAVATFTATLSAASANPVTFHYGTSDGSARAGFDYTAKSGVVTLAPGQVTASIPVPVLATSVASASRYFYVSLGTVVNATLGNGQGVGTILNSNHTAYVTVDDTATTASTSVTGTINFTVRLTSAATFPVTVDYGTSDGSATAAANDYVPAFGTLTFAPGITVQTVPVSIGTQLSAAATKYLILSLGTASTGATIMRGSAYGSIGGPTANYHQLQVGDIGLVRGTSGTSALAIPVTLTPAATGTVTVHYNTQDSSAVTPGDYSAASGTLTFTAGQTTQTANVNVVGDTTTFVDKTFYLNLSTATGATIDRSTGVGVISTGNTAPVVSVDSIAMVKPASGTMAAAFTLHLSNTSPNPVTVNYATSDGSATVAGGSYAAASGSATIPAGQLTATVNVTVNGNTLPGGNLYFYLTLNTPVNGVLAGNNSALAYIANPNYAPSLSVNNVAVYAPLTGTATATFTVTLSSASTQTVTVNYATSDGSATVTGGDYTAATGTLTFAPGALTKTVPVAIGATTVAHASRYFYMYLASPTNATIVSSSGTGTVLDDAVTPFVSVNNPSIPSGPTSTTMNYTVSLTSPTVNTVTVHYATSDGSAIAGSQYTAVSGTLTFTPGVTTQVVPVTILPSTIKAADRYFYLNLSTPTNAVVASPNYGQGEILNTAVQPDLTIGDITVARPTSGTSNAVFTVTLAPSSLNTVTVNYATSDGTAHAPTDYTAASGSLTFTPGTTTQTITVPIKGNAASTPDLYYAVSLATAVNATLQRNTAYGYLVDQVAPVSGKSYVTVSDAEAVVPTTGTVTEAFDVTLALPATAPVYVRYSTQDSNAMTGADYTGVRGTLLFAPGQTKKTVNVTVNSSTASSADKGFYFSIQVVNGPGILVRSSAVGYLLNPNPTAMVSVAGPAAVIKGDSGTTNAVFTVQLSAPQAQSVQVDYVSYDGAATAAGNDYQPTFGILTFTPGQTSQTVSVVVNSNTLPKPTTYFYLGLTNPVGLTVTGQAGVGYILNLDVFSIAGSVIDPSGAPVAGATITRTGNNQPTATATTAANGTFTLPNTLNGKYTLTPTLAGKVFLPATLSATVRGAAVAGGVFIAYSGAAITGQAITASAAADAGVTMTRTGGGQATATATTDSLGYYVFGSLPNGTNYVITPTKAGQVAVPASLTTSITGTTVAKQDFVMVTAAYVTGRVVTAGVGVAGVTMTLTGGTQPSTKVTTDSQGYYGFSAVAATVAVTNYTVTPTSTGHTFSPVSLTAPVSTTTNATGINFTQI
jgi:hypothetical protein